MGGVWGLLDLNEERRRVGPAVVDYAVSSIVANLESWREQGSLQPRRDIVSLIESGRFPDYEYSTIDVIRAHRRHLGQKKHKPLGVTSCVDEAVLISSLATVLNGISLVELIIMGAPIHYTTLLRHLGKSYWFNGKQEYFDQKTWRARFVESGPASVQEAFDRRTLFDRIITPSGSFLFQDRVSTLSPDLLAAAIEWITGFFGTELHQLGEVSLRDVAYQPSPLDTDRFAAFDEMQGAQSVRQYLREQAVQRPGTSFEAALYSFRDLSVEHPEAYLAAALRGHKVRALADQCESLADAFATVREISGEDSIFHDDDRLSLPDEVILFQTGSKRDKAFLLFSLVQLATRLPDSIRQESELLCVGDDTWIRLGPDWFSAPRWEKIAPQPGAPAVFHLQANSPTSLGGT